MPTRTKVEFEGHAGHALAGLLERPDAPPVGTALFAHCFTCGKDVAAASRIARAMVARGFAVLRFDFTGLGNSDGDFANTALLVERGGSGGRRRSPAQTPSARPTC